MQLPDQLVELVRGTATCYLATLMPDGSPQLTMTWVDTDGEHIVINTVETHQKVRNVRRDPRVALTISDHRHPSRYTEVRGRVIELSTDGAADHIEVLAQRYLGRPYPWFGGRDQQRLLMIIAVDRLRSQG